MRSAGKRTRVLSIFLTILVMLGPSSVMGASMTGDGKAPRAQARALVPSTDPGSGNLGPGASKNSSLLWSLDPPTTTWNLTHNHAIEFVVTVAGNPSIQSLGITHSTVADSDSSRGVTLPAKDFRICPSLETSFDACNGVLEPPKQQTAAGAAGEQHPPFKNTLWIKIAPGIVPNGVFTGNLTLDTDPATDSKTIALTIQHTSSTAKLKGVALLVGGVVVAWFVTVFARSRINRDQALLPVVLLKQRLRGLRSRLNAIPSTFEGDLTLTPSRIAAVDQELTSESLDAHQLLPPRIPGWTQAPATQATAYQTFMQLASQTIEDLDVIVTGLENAASFLPSTPPDHLRQLHTLMANIDALSGTLPQIVDSLRSQVKALINSFGGVVAPRALEFAVQRLSPSQGSTSELTPVRINFQIETITLLYWAVWGALSVIVGFTVLVQPVPGFGAFGDYVRCCLWGFGLPVAGQGLQQLTMSSVNTQLGVNFPK
jgi:hypothetical protein